MIQSLKRIHKVLSALLKLIPVLIEVMADFADDGEINQSNKKSE